MQEELKISDDVLQNVSIEDLAELKVEVEDLLSRLDNIINICDEALNS